MPLAQTSDPIAYDDPNGWIVAIARAQDRDSFAKLFCKFAPKLKTYFLRSGLEDDEAEDLSQEVMLLIWRKAAQFDPARAEAWGWIYAIARNVRIDRFRRQKRRFAWPFIVETLTEHPDEQIAQQDDARRLDRALIALPDDQIAVVRLAYYHDKPHSEIAHDLNVPLGTVKSRLRRAAARLRTNLSE